MHRGRGMNAGRRPRLDVEQRRGPGESHIGIKADQLARRAGGAELFPDDDRRGPGARQLAGIGGIGKKAQLAGNRAGERAEADNLAFAVAFELDIEQLREP